ncbi:DUF4132 domain-containing protein [Leptotrichia trevisanii]|uniref:DUF4132 domain-containing protein n=1 Tax=Leptotrichia trevisanii TaxID=109328 RepID=UPI0026F2090D|nr:DUF4132 domain-containing protein [Leptotrichia trevisanii]
MTKNEVIENLVSEVEEESHRNRIKKFLNGETDNFLYITKKNLRFVNNFKMEDFTKNKNFFKTEAGEVLLKYFKYMYNNFPDELSYQFSNFPLKYKIFKMLNFSEEFVKKDFENNLEMKDKEVFAESCEYFLNYFENLTDEYVQNYKEYCDNFLLKIGILIIIRNIDKKKSEEIEKLESIFINYIKNKINKYNINEIFEKHLDKGNFRKYFESVEELCLEKSRKYIEKVFFWVLKKNTDISRVISEGIELFIMFSEIEFSSTNNNYYYRNKIFDNLKRIFKKYSFSHGQKLYLLVNYGTNVIFYNFDYSKKMYGLFLDTIKENVANTKAFLKDNLKEKKIAYLFLLHFLIKYDLITEKEKSKFLTKAENMLISNLKKLFKAKIWRWKPKEFKNLEFLKESNINWENIQVQCFRSKSEKVLTYKDKIVFSLLKYSETYKKIFQFFVNGIKEIDLFEDIIEWYNVIYDISDLKLILDEMWGYNLSINFINEKYFEYIEKTGSDDENNKIWMEFLHKHEKELYKSFENDINSAESVKKYVEILYLKNNSFDYFQLPKLLLKADKQTGQQIEEILREKAEIREEVEKLLEKKFTLASQVAKKLIKYWDNAEAQRELKNLTDPEEIFEYSENICLEKHEENAIFSNLIDYGMVRIKKSEEKVPEKLMKFYISEYILAKDIKTIEVCNKIEQIVDKSDLKKFLSKIFEKWKEQRFNPKYKNIFIPLIMTANMKQVHNMVNIVDMIVSEYNKVPVAAYGIRVLALRSETKEIGILLKVFFNNYKDKRIKTAAEQSLDVIARNAGITRDELDDILVPDFGFGQDRIRLFDYGERKIKVKLDVMSIPAKITAYDENEKILKGLPKASKKFNDVESIVEEYRREIKHIRKLLKEITVSQANSLLNALFLERKWQVKKWIETFIHNPVMQTFAIQLIWKETDENDRLIKTFRYTEDGTFKTAQNQECVLNEDSFVNLLYFPELSEEEQRLWERNLENNKIKQPIKQTNIPVYKITEKNQEKIEILDYNKKGFLVNKMRKKTEKLGFKLSYGNNGLEYGSYYYDKKTNINIMILTNSFFPGEYTKTLQIEKIMFLKNSTSIQSEKSSENRYAKFLKLKEVPERLLSLACFMAEILIN